MDRLQLAETIGRARLCQNIAFRFEIQRYHEISDLIDFLSKLKTLYDEGVIVLRPSKKDPKTVIFAKTLIFRDGHVAEIVAIVPSFVKNVQLMEMPDYKIALTQSNGFWHLTLTGGNKMLRCFFESCSKIPKQPITLVGNAAGIVTLRLEGTDDEILRIAETIANMFKVDLTI